MVLCRDDAGRGSLKYSCGEALPLHINTIDSNEKFANRS